MEKLKEKIMEDEAVTRNVTNASDFQYMNCLRFNLNCINAWPGNQIEGTQTKYKILINIFMLLVNFFCITSSMHYMMSHWDSLSFYELGHTYIVFFIIIVTVTRLVLTLPQSTKYINIGVVFLTKMHLLYFKDGSEYAMKTYKKKNIICRLFTIILTFQMFSGLTLYNIIPMWSNYAAGKYKERNLYNTTYEHSLYLSVPKVNIYTDFNAYLPACLFHWFLACVCSITVCMLDLLLSIMVFNLWGHIKILLHDLKTFPLPANEVTPSKDDKYASVSTKMYSKEELKVISQKLRHCIDYHRLILDFTDKMSDAFGPILFVSYMFYQVSGCLLLLELSQMTAQALIRYLPLSVILLQQLIQVSVIFELIGSTSDKLKDAVYGVPWQYMDLENRKIVGIFLFYVQEPIQLKALGVVNVGVTTMATILKTSLSFFTFLRSM